MEKIMVLLAKKIILVSIFSVAAANACDENLKAGNSKSAKGTLLAANKTQVKATDAPAGQGLLEDSYVFSVPKMHCGSCETAIQKSVSSLAGVASVHADHKTGKVTVVSEGPSRLDPDKVKEAIEKAGYQVAGRDK